ncbi:MAG: hypothetical protein U0V56_03550 [Actinomycetota bacterium]
MRKYVAGLTAFRNEDLAGWCRTFSEALTTAADRAIDLGETRGTRGRLAGRARRPRQGSTARRLIDGLVGHPVVSVESVEALLGVSDEAARLALTRLEGDGVLRQVTVGRRNRAWAAVEVFELLDDFDATIRSA